jgi:hypothetical protein
LSASAERRMPRRDGEVFLRGTAISGPLGMLLEASSETDRWPGAGTARAEDADKAALIEEGSR